MAKREPSRPQRWADAVAQAQRRGVVVIRAVTHYREPSARQGGFQVVHATATTPDELASGALLRTLCGIRANGALLGPVDTDFSTRVRCARCRASLAKRS